MFFAASNETISSRLAPSTWGTTIVFVNMLAVGTMTSALPESFKLFRADPREANQASGTPKSYSKSRTQKFSKTRRPFETLNKPALTCVVPQFMISLFF